ncbi:MAG: GMC family oxidoreductase, partial [Gammaproteobacteria bacterium]|nr:GMC family oxidoreductase [Gammaproteobacteria bacterium]
HPGLAAGILGWHGQKLAAGMKDLPRLNALIALQRDGFDEQSPGGEVQLQGDGRGVLDYPLNDHLWDGVRRAWHAMAEIQFAAGAHEVMPGHLDGEFETSLDAVRQQIDRLPLAPYKVALFSAHLMGGCNMGANPRASVIAGSGRHHQLDNLTVVDGSIFPTSVGANPQLSIFAHSARITTGLVRELKPGALAGMP